MVADDNHGRKLCALPEGSKGDFLLGRKGVSPTQVYRDAFALKKVGRVKDEFSTRALPKGSQSFFLTCLTVACRVQPRSDNRGASIPNLKTFKECNMRNLKIFLLISIIPFLISCATSKSGDAQKLEVAQILVQQNLDKIIATYPQYRIDDRISRISIIGGESENSEITSFLTRFFMRQRNVKVIEPGNLQAILGGKIIEYGTGLSSSEAQALSQMFQIDHILIFEEKVSPPEEYIYGGKADVRINLKIINTLNGEILYQAGNKHGMFVPDPREINLHLKGRTTSFIEFLRNRCLRSILHELSYAMGDSDAGFNLGPGDIVIIEVLRNSLAERVGLQRGDKFVESNGLKVHSFSEFVESAKNIKQGEEWNLKIERGGKALEFTIKIPTIHHKPEEKKKEKPEEKEKSKDKETPL